jgi:hypothetical protein
MADALNVTSAAIGLAALFTTCLQVWDFVDAGRAHGNNFSLLRTKLDNERILFVIWGKKMGFGSKGPSGTASNDGYDERLDDPDIATTVKANLHHIQNIFSDTDAMIDKYGIHVFQRKPKTKTRKHRSSRARNKSSTKKHLRPANFQTSYRKLLKQLSHGQVKTSPWKATRWSIKDESKFEQMVKDLTELVEGLGRITAAFTSQARADELVGDEMENIHDLESLAEIEKATNNAAVKNATSIRRWILVKRNGCVWASKQETAEPATRPEPVTRPVSAVQSARRSSIVGDRRSFISKVFKTVRVEEAHSTSEYHADPKPSNPIQPGQNIYAAPQLVDSSPVSYSGSFYEKPEVTYSTPMEPASFWKAFPQIYTNNVATV